MRRERLTAPVELSASMSARSRAYSCGLRYTDPGGWRAMIRGTASSGSEPMYSSIAATYSSGAKRNTACLRSSVASTALATLRAAPPPPPRWATPARAAAVADAAAPGMPLAEPTFAGVRLPPPAPAPAPAPAGTCDDGDGGGGGDGALAAEPKLPRRLYACPCIGSVPPLRSLGLGLPRARSLPPGAAQWGRDERGAARGEEDEVARVQANEPGRVRGA